MGAGVIPRLTVRLMFPLLALGAVALFGLSAVVALPVSAVYPFIAVVQAFRSPDRGRRIFSDGVDVLVANLRYVGTFIKAVSTPVARASLELTEAELPKQLVRLKPGQVLPIHRLSQQVAAALKVEPAHEFWLSPDASLRVGEHRVEGKRVRYMLVGLGLVRLLTAAELRAAFAAEYGSVRAGQAWLSRWLRRCMTSLLETRRINGAGYPVSWAAGFALKALRAVYARWARAQVFAADRFTAEVCGRETAVGALKRISSVRPAHDASLEQVVHRIELLQMAPKRLSECATARATRMSASVHRDVAGAKRADPYQLDGKDRVSLDQRLRALSLSTATARLPTVPALDLKQLAVIDERLTPVWLSDVRVALWVSIEEFLTPRTKTKQMRLLEGAAANAKATGAPERAELDPGTRWSNQRAARTRTA